VTTTASAAGVSSSPSSVWLHGRAADLLLGYGLGYLLSVPLLIGVSVFLPAGNQLVWIYGLIAIAAQTPHYGATILRVYEEGSERRKYAVFAVWMTAALVALFGVSLYDRFLGSVLLTVYVTWSPWHFSGQNYGLSVMYLRRRGIPVTPELERPLYLSFVLSAVLAMLTMHAADSSGSSFVLASDPSGTFQMLPLGIPPGVALALALGGALAYLGSLFVFARRLRPRPALSELTPVLLLVSTQALWFAVPATLLALGRPGFSQLLPFTAFAISAAHALQYLWVTSYYARLARRPSQTAPFFGRTLLAGSAVSVPGLLFVPALFGASVPNGAGVLLLSFAVLNLHHFILDGAIWKLRDGRVAKALLRSQSDEGAPASAQDGRRRWLPILLWTVGVVGVSWKLWVVGLEFVSTRDVDLELQQAATYQLELLGQDTADQWGALGRRLEAEGEPELAIDAYRKAVEGQESPDLIAANQLARLLVARHATDGASLHEAIALARQVAAGLGSSSPTGLVTLASAYAAAGQYADAAEAATGAAQIARRNGSFRRAEKLDRRAELHRVRAREIDPSRQ
jgi:hypothetical protein